MNVIDLGPQRIEVDVCTTQYVYLAGPIAGCTADEAQDWRHRVAADLPTGFVGVNPLRCEPCIGEVYENVYDDSKFGSPNAIFAKNWYDLHRCDWILAYMPKQARQQKGLSIGTLFEIAWATHANRKPLILVTDDEKLSTHPLIKAQVRWILTTFEDAYQVLLGVGNIYRS